VAFLLPYPETRGKFSDLEYDTVLILSQGGLYLNG